MVFIPVNASRQLYVAFPRVMARVIARSPSDYTFEGKIQKIWAFHSWLLCLEQDENATWFYKQHQEPPTPGVGEHSSVRQTTITGTNGRSVKCHQSFPHIRQATLLHPHRSRCHEVDRQQKCVSDVNGIHFLTDAEGNQWGMAQQFFLALQPQPWLWGDGDCNSSIGITSGHQWFPHRTDHWLFLWTQILPSYIVMIKSLTFRCLKSQIYIYWIFFPPKLCHHFFLISDGCPNLSVDTPNAVSTATFPIRSRPRV